MNKEQQLEQVVNSIKEFKVPKSPPVFEMFAALVAISIAVLLLLLPGVFEQNQTLFYRLMRAVLPQTGWAIAFFAGGVGSAVGMLLDRAALRIAALLVMTVLFGVVAAFYIATFPNLAGILMFWTTIFSGASVPLVKYSSIRAKVKKTA